MANKSENDFGVGVTKADNDFGCGVTNESRGLGVTLPGKRTEFEVLALLATVRIRGAMVPSTPPMVRPSRSLKVVAKSSLKKCQD